ncbi:CocE/NonD family hydrolase [Candidatus Sodalis pierantonius]|uniref:CocE/NonD family hydrolase n=1 Tax=Candidatus Sodalis pierantonii TaxID=1486991 RepID=UPI00130E0306|nr:CocE/NonD family hydrolase [Candidatus Sodalis pierantonius]
MLEWISYRQSDNTATGDAMMHGVFAAHGIAAMRIDLRGSGNSDGLLRDEYLAQEQDDAVEVIAWIARQAWCNGNVGMIGISWGGFAALQIAARRPPALKAIITCCSTDDRYSDDVHYMGGALLTDGLQWDSGLFTQLGRPLDPAHVGERWREGWLSRLEGMEPPLAHWLAHGDRDAFWRHGSVCEDYQAIECAVYAVGGWTDGYCDAILRLMHHLDAPRKGLIGPWTHVYPTWGLPGPAIDFLGECLRFWRQWQQGEITGIMDEPMLRLWQGEGLRAYPRGITLGGQWLSAPEFQADQRSDDALSQCFDTPRLTAPLTLCGKAALEVAVAFESPSALLVLRLNEVSADGHSARVTFGVHRLTRPEGVTPGELFRVRLSFKGVAYRFSPGCRLRLALSTAYWPMVWAEPGQGPVRLWPEGAVLQLPGLGDAITLDDPAFGAPRSAPPHPHEAVSPEVTRRQVEWDVGAGIHRVVMDAQRQHTRIGELCFGSEGHEVYTIGALAESARMETHRVQRYTRPGWDIRLECDTDLAWRAGGLVLTSRYQAWENDRSVFSREWCHRFPSRHRDESNVGDS